MKLYGTTTSPFTRRVAIVAAEVGEPVEWVNTATEAGQALLREVSPIRKVPVATLDDRTVFDSRAIAQLLIATRGYGGIAPAADPWEEQNALNAIDAAIDSMIQLFYLRRDGVAIDGNIFAQRHLDRTDAIIAWLGNHLTADRFGLAELSVICALDWMEFRKAYPIERAAALAPIRDAWRDRPSIAATVPRA